MQYIDKFKAINILIIEDDDIDAKAITRTLEKYTHNICIHRAYDGIEALNKLRGENGHNKLPAPYILLVDINMPLINGIKFIENVRNDLELKSAIVFVLTTSNSIEDKIATYNLNIAGYIIKTDIKSSYTKLAKLLDTYIDIVEFL